VAYSGTTVHHVTSGLRIGELPDETRVADILTAIPPPTDADRPLDVERWGAWWNAVVEAAPRFAGPRTRTLPLAPDGTFPRPPVPCVLEDGYLQWLLPAKRLDCVPRDAVWRRAGDALLVTWGRAGRWLFPGNLMMRGEGDRLTHIVLEAA
jgi:hypothetical protein